MQEKVKTPEQNLEEMCWKYFEAKYMLKNGETKNNLHLIDTLYRGDSLLIHLRFIDPLEEKIRELCIEYIDKYNLKERESDTKGLFSKEILSCVSHLLEKINLLSY